MAVDDLQGVCVEAEGESVTGSRITDVRVERYGHCAAGVDLERVVQDSRVAAQAAVSRHHTGTIEATTAVDFRTNPVVGPAAAGTVGPVAGDGEAEHHQITASGRVRRDVEHEYRHRRPGRDVATRGAGADGYGHGVTHGHRTIPGADAGSAGAGRATTLARGVALGGLGRGLHGEIGGVDGGLVVAGKQNEKVEHDSTPKVAVMR